MQVYPLSQVLTMPVGTVVPAIQVRIEKVQKYYQGTNEHGAWSIQAIDVADGSGRSKAKLNGHQELAAGWAGQTVYFLSGVNGKNKPSGIEVVEDEYRGQKSIILKINKDARIETAQPQTGAPAPAMPAPQPAALPPPTAQAPLPPPGALPPPAVSLPPATLPPPVQAPAPLAPPVSAPLDPKKAVVDCRRRLGRSLNSMKLSFAAAIALKKWLKEKHGEEITSDGLERIAVSFNITMEREGLAESLPTGDIEDKAPPAAGQ